jgi:hypothetical protein
MLQPLVHSVADDVEEAGVAASPRYFGRGASAVARACDK